MHTTEPSGPLVRASFRLALAGLGIGLRLACRCSGRFRSQLTGKRTVQIGSADGVVHHYVFGVRALVSRAGPADETSVDLCFDNARLGVITLVSPRAIGRIVRALLERRATYTGNAVLVLWFFALTRFVLPLARTAPLRTPLPNAYIEPDPRSRVASRIVREAAVNELDPGWSAAHRQRAKMIMLRGSAGESVRLW